MPYIGNPSAQRFTSPRAASVYSGDGSTVAFTLEEVVSTDEDILVSVDGVIQEPSVAYAVSSGTTLTFTAAPSTNSGNNIFVYYIARTFGSVSMPDGQNVNAANFSASGTGAITGNTTVGGTLGVTGAATLSSSLAMTSDDPTITMTDSSGTNDIGTIQATSGALIFTARDTSADGEIIFKKFDGTTTDESARITSGGSLCVGKTSDALDDNSGVVLNGAGGFIRIERSNDPCLQINRHSGDGVAVQFFSGASSQVGNITIASSSTAYNTSSDHRLKENVDYSFDATTRLKQLKPARFNFKSDADTTVDGFLAHEVQSVVPESITGTHNEVDDDGNAVMQGIDQSKLVPLLVKTIQELEARITALESA